MWRWSRVLVLLALLPMQSGAVDRAYGSPARTPNYPGVDVSNGCYMYTDGKVFCNDGGYALSNIVPQYTNEKIQIVIIMEVVGALRVCVAADCANVSGSTTITFPEFGESVGGADLLQITCISGPVRWYIQEINLIPISVPDTPTATSTVNPSSTATNTVVPGSTNTPIPTSTPRGSVATLTPSPTGTPGPTAVPSERNCGSPGIPVLNCDWLGGVWLGAAADHWTLPLGTISNTLAYCGASQGYPVDQVGNLCYQGDANMQYQSTTVTVSGPVVVDYQQSFTADFYSVFALYDGSWVDQHLVSTACPVGGGSYCSVTLSTVTAGDNVKFAIGLFDGGSNTTYIKDVHIVGEAATVTPTPTLPIPTDTPYPIPGASLTPYPSPTNCPGGCAVGDSTQIPAAIDTVVGIDTSPLTPLELLSVGRTSCQSFGAVPLVEPHLFGTPIYGSSQPISITWTVPATGTQFQPCADPSFSSAWWDTMWNLSILVAIVCWIGWLIHWVRGLFS